VTSQSGSVSITNGLLTYTPRADFSGIDTFVFTVTDNGVTGTLPDPRSVTRTMTVRVLDVNDPPITTPKQGQIVEDRTFTRPVAFFLNNDSPVEPGQSLVFVFDTNSPISTTSTRGGTVTFDGTNVSYTPARNFNGTDTFFYLVTDNGPNPTNSVGTVTMTVTPENDPPEIVTGFPGLILAEDAPEQEIDLRLYFTDPDIAPNNDSLTYRVSANNNASLVDISFAGNTMFVRPRADQHGSAVVSIEARDSTGATVVNVLNITVTPVEDSPRLVSPLPDISVNEDSVIPPIALSPTFFFDPDVLTNNDELTYVVEVTNTNLLTATVVNGQLRLTLVANASGSARVTVTSTDRAGNAISDSFDVLVNAVNDGPVGAADGYDVPLGSAFTTTDPTGALTASANDNGVLANDVDAEGNTFTARLTRNPSVGTVTLNPDGTFTYQTNAQAVVGGTDTFEYEGVDSFGAVGNRTTVTIRIGNPLPSPHRNPSTLRDQDGRLIGNLDVDADGNVSAIDALIVVNFINANGSVPVSGLSAPPPFRDVNGNLFIDPLDVLEVVNYLNSRSNFTGNGEGEDDSQVMMVGVGSSSSSQLAWSHSISRDNSNAEIELSNVVVGPALPRQTNDSLGMSLADYLAGFVDDEDDDDIATALVSNVDPGNELLDSIFADAFLE
jgi:VCBS repeat-containing protein